MKKDTKRTKRTKNTKEKEKMKQQVTEQLCTYNFSFRFLLLFSFFVIFVSFVLFVSAFKISAESRACLHRFRRNVDGGPHLKRLRMSAASASAFGPTRSAAEAEVITSHLTASRAPAEGGASAPWV